MKAVGTGRACSPARAMKHYDRSYKKLFSHPEMVIHLLLLIPEKWVQELEWASLQRVNPVLQGSRSRERQADMVWRVLHKGVWVYLLLEFQSTVDPHMPMRILACTALQYQEMVREGVLSPLGRLYPVLPAVLYTGPQPWNVPSKVQKMFKPVPDGMEKHVPHLRYLLLDAVRQGSRSGPTRGNLVNSLFCMEACRTPSELVEELGHLNLLLAKPGREELRKSFSSWLHEAYLPSRLGRRFPGIGEADIHEVRRMIELREDAWCLQWRDEGRQEGLRDLLLHQLRRKFGTVDKKAEQRVESASDQKLLDWGERLLGAATLEQVFEESGQP